MTNTRRPIAPDRDASEQMASALFERRSDGIASVPCPPPELVQASRMGVLPPDLQERVATHITGCTVCRALADALDDETVISVMPAETARIRKRVESGIAGARISGSIWWRGLAAAAVLGIVGGSLFVWQSWRTEERAVSTQVSREQRPSAPPTVFNLDKPAIRPSVPAELVWRGSGGAAPSEDLSRAFEAYRNGNFADAVATLRALLPRYPESATVRFYLGVSDLFLKDDADAVTTLQAAVGLAKDDSGLQREATWYLAIAYHRTGQLDQARAALEGLCRTTGRRVVRACAGVRELSGPITLHGVVTGRDGVRLAGAKVAALSMRFGPDFNVAFPDEPSTTTGTDGHYTVSGVQTQVLQVYKAGYFSSARVITTIIQDTQLDFALEPWTFILLGETVRRTIKPGDAVCGDPDELCHRFALTAPSDGTLDVSLSSSSPGTVRSLPLSADALRNWDLHVETPTGEAYGPPNGASFPFHLAVRVEKGSTYQIRVLSFADHARDYELRTQLRQ